MDDLKREVDQDAQLQNAARHLADLLSRAELDQLQEAADRNDVEAIAKALDLGSVAQLESLDALLKERADFYSRYPDLKRFTERRRRRS